MYNNTIIMSGIPTSNVFDSFTEYNVKILVSPWSTNNVLSFALSCVGLFVMAGLYHAFRFGRKQLEAQIREVLEKNDAEERTRLMSTEYQLAPLPKKNVSAGVYVGLVFLALFTNAYSMLLVMALMSFNPWVFMSIALGYTTGDMITHKPIMKLKIR